MAENITIEDCIDMFIYKEYNTLIENGRIVGFAKDTGLDFIVVK